MQNKKIDNVFYLKKAAMFGLDARIALAIFGALSVIAGAALYNVLNNVEVTKTIQEMNEFGKAYEQYLLDMSKDLPMTSGSNIYFKVEDLVINTDSKWKGPYINYKTTAFDYKLSRNGDVSKEVLLAKIPTANWGNVAYGSSGAVIPACAGYNCYTWIAFSLEKDLALKILKKIDGHNDGTIDNVRIGTGADPKKLFVYYKYNTAYSHP